MVAVVALGLITFFIIRGSATYKSCRGRGWTFESRPALESVLDHRAPPFGLGFVRKVDEAISGQASAGVPFRVFEYSSSDGGPKFDDRVASVQLPLPLPDLFVSTNQRRAGVHLPAVEVDPQFQVHAADPDYARSVMSAAVLDAIAAFGRHDRESISALTGSNWSRSAHLKILTICRATSSSWRPSRRRSNPESLALYRGYLSNQDSAFTAILIGNSSVVTTR